MSGDSTTLKTSHGFNASKHGAKPAKPKSATEEVDEIAPEGEVLSGSSGPQGNPKEPIVKLDLGGDVKFSWKVDKTGEISHLEKIAGMYSKLMVGSLLIAMARRLSPFLRALLLETTLSAFPRVLILEMISCIWLV